MKREENKTISAQAVINELKATGTQEETKSTNVISDHDDYIDNWLARDQKETPRQVCGGGSAMSAAPTYYETRVLQKPLSNIPSSNQPKKKTKTQRIQLK